MDWRFLGLVPLVRAGGEDISRSAAGRGAAESVWVPTSLLPRFGVQWSATDAHHISARYALDATDIEVHYTLDDQAHLRSMTFDRWGDPAGTGNWGWHPAGFEVTRTTTFGGLTIPSAGRFGWFFGTGRWPEGEFFRFRLTDLRLVRPPRGSSRSESGGGPQADKGAQDAAPRHWAGRLETAPWRGEDEAGEAQE
jgi:hypothetical protein